MSLGFGFVLFVYFCKEISQGLLYTHDPPSVASWVMAGLLCLVQQILFLQTFQPLGPGSFFSAVEDLASGSTNSFSSSVAPTLFLQSIRPSPKLISFYYVHVPLTFLSLESINSPWGIFPPEEKQPFFCLVIWIFVRLNGVSCNSDSPQIYYAGEDDLELLILRPLPPVTAGITGLPCLSQPQHLVLSSFFYSLHWHRRSLSPRGMLGTLLFPGLISTVPNMQ